MAQQTAVEWLKKEISNEDYHTEGELGNSCIDVNTLLILFEQAKQMEKEQLHKCASFWRGKENEIEKPIFQQYYNETYGKK